MTTEVITELTIDASGADDGAARYAAAMAGAQAVTDKMMAALVGMNTTLASANDNLTSAANAATGAVSSYKQSADAADAAASSHHAFVGTLGELASIAGLAGKAISFFATSGVAQMAVLGGSFAFVSGNFQNSFAQSIATGTATALGSISGLLRGLLQSPWPSRP